MISVVIWIALVLLAGYFLVRKFKSTDEKLRSARAQREARMLSAAMQWRDSQHGREQATK